MNTRGFHVDPQKGMVEAGTHKAVKITWTPPKGHDVSTNILSLSLFAAVVHVINH